MENLNKNRFSYFALLSPDPIYIPNAGSILSPRLKDISAIGFHTYQYYLSVLLMNEKTFSSLSQSNIFDLFMADESSALLLKDVLNFFIKEEIVHPPEHNCLLARNGDSVTGIITGENYPQICDVICQRNYIRSAFKEDPSKIKSKKASEIVRKLQQGRAKKAARTSPDENMELGNIISAVANKSQSLNILNIWDLTVFQVWDCFARLSNNSIYDIQSMSVAAWGNKNNSFDASAWYKRIYTEN